MAYSKSKYLKSYSFKIFVFSVFIVLFFLFLFMLSQNRDSKDVYSVNTENLVIVIDPGHGGVDTGAVGNGNVYESTLCLSLSKKITSMLTMSGYNVVITRNDDKMLTDKNVTSSRKRADLAGRVSFTNSFDNPVFISIHMNTYPLESCSGAQIFYSQNNENSKVLADTLNSCIKTLQPDNTRKNKTAGDNIYVLSHLNCPAVLIECGFLTNEKELALLCDDEYENKLAATIASGICKYIENS